jgi:hypothetical protein
MYLNDRRNVQNVVRRQAGLLLLFSHATDNRVRLKATRIFVNREENGGKQRQWQLALRESAAGMHQSKRVLALVSVAAILGVSGPFGTHDQMQILPRLLYWGVLSSAIFWLGNFAAFCARQIHPAQQIAQFATATLFGAVIITGFILAINWLFLQVTVTSAVNLISLFFQIGILVGVVNVTQTIADR